MQQWGMHKLCSKRRSVHQAWGSLHRTKWCFPWPKADDFTSELDKKLGPFQLTEVGREQQRHHRVVEIPPEKQSERVKRKKELVHEIMWTQWGKTEGQTKVENMLHSELVKKAAGLGIEIKITPTTKTVHGWLDQGKGLLQIAYERSWVDKKNYQSFQVMKYDDDVNLIP